jgi:hypothetical protein
MDLKRRQLLWLGLAGAAGARAANEAPPAGALPWAGWRQAGSGVYTYWGFDIYQASLRVDPAWNRPWGDAALTQASYALELRYLRGFRGADIARRSVDEMRRLGALDDAQAVRWLQAMGQAFPDVVRDDRITGVHVAGEGARFFHNERPSGEVRDEEFARRFFGIWLSGATTAPELRARLLAGLAGA